MFEQGVGNMPQLYFDNPSYNLIVVVCLIFIPAIINYFLNKLYNVFTLYKNSLSKSGKDCVIYFLNKNKLPMIDIYPSQNAGYLDSYSSKRKLIIMNLNTYSSPDVASMSKAFYLIAPALLDDKSKAKFDKIGFISSLFSIFYIILGPGFIWFGLMFKINVLVMLGLIFTLLFFIYHLITYPYIKKRIDLAIGFLDTYITKKEEIFYIKKIYQRQKTIYLLSFLLEGCKIFNFLLPGNMKKAKLPKEKRNKN